jgi:hypothetical protein
VEESLDEHSEVQSALENMFDITTYRISLKVRFFEVSPSASRAVL